jgi:hypothetical protein
VEIKIIIVNCLIFEDEEVEIRAKKEHNQFINKLLDCLK